MKWRFVQSNRIRINPPDETTNSGYYAYTEIYSDRARKVLLKEGYNKVLVRLESGPGVAYFSLVLCPVDLDRS